MIIQVISDIHGSYRFLQTALNSFKSINPDIILLCGDYLNHGPRNPLPQGHDTMACASLLNDNVSKIIGVRGNCDSEVDQMVLKFPCLGPYTTLFFKRNTKSCGRIFVHHGHLYTKEQLKEMLPKGTLVISGHTHVSLLEEEGGYFWFNPGSISLPKCEDGNTCGIICTDDDGIKEVSLYTIEGKKLKSLEIN